MLVNLWFCFIIYVSLFTFADHLHLMICIVFLMNLMTFHSHLYFLVLMIFEIRCLLICGFIILSAYNRSLLHVISYYVVYMLLDNSYDFSQSSVVFDVDDISNKMLVDLWLCHLIYISSFTFFDLHTGPLVNGPKPFFCQMNFPFDFLFKIRCFQTLFSTCIQDPL